MSMAERIHADIERRIRRGEWTPGARIPFEQELAASYGCARGTANKALSRLAREGLIERRRKAGSFVARPQIRSAMLSVPDIGALIAGRGETYAWRLIDSGETGAPAEFGGGGQMWLRLSGVHHADARPFGHEARWIDLATVPDAAAVDFIAQPAGSWLLGHVPWTEARHRVRAVAPNRAVARRLNIAASAPCLQIERWTWRSGAPVTYVRLTFPGDRYDLVEEFTPR